MFTNFESRCTLQSLFSTTADPPEAKVSPSDIHDNHGQREGEHWDEHLIPGEGEIDWERFMSILARVNYNGVLVVEVPPKGPIESRLEEIQRWMQWAQQRITQS